MHFEHSRSEIFKQKMSGRRGFQTARLDFPQNTKKLQNPHIVTGHHFRKTLPAGKILLGTVLLVNRTYTSYAF